jgi:dihydroxy-acid dehydratase
MAIVRDGDTIVIDVESRRLDIDLSEDTIRQRLTEWTCPKPRYDTGVFAKYVKLVSSASQGAVTG